MPEVERGMKPPIGKTALRVRVGLADLRAAISDFGQSRYHTPFAPGAMIVKTASFPKGKVPAHLDEYTFDIGAKGKPKSDACKGVKGTVVYKGKLIPRRARCIAKEWGY